MGYVHSSVISGMVHQVEEKLFEKGDEKSFYTIGFCAQTLNDMRHFDYSLKLFNLLKDDKRLPLDQKGMVLHTIGMVYEAQRKWEEALENYNQALEWYKNTGQNHELGGTYHQFDTFLS
jgi:tetratricopeptide (TPR) repeat protein